MMNCAPTQSPGDFIRKQMEAKGWTQSDLAYALGMPGGSVNPILSNKRAISINMARALAAALDIDAAKIAAIQAAWDVASAADPDPSIAARSRILSKYPLREMARRGWVDPEHGKGTLEEQICRFFGVKSLDDLPHLSHSAKKTSYSALPPTQLAWLFRVREIAFEMEVAPYNPTKLSDALEQMASLRSDPDAVRYVPSLLSESGVRFVVVEGLPGSNIDGVCLWLDSGSPVIGISLRFDRIDNFWFVLRHECAHVLHGHGQKAAIVDSDLDSNAASSVNEEERLANEEAADFCVPAKSMQSFYLRKHPFFAEREVVAFATRMKVHPGLVVGQLQRMLNRYDLLRKYLVRVRQPLANAMMMDGWGDVVPVER